ncbi:MAG TPA: SGNH/GDSL hydrolase family protein [Gaiellaceae bacterium]|nr:SGNH/GDSL hydrolase family protein [Gaiellaceae bacterium]
MQAKHRRWAVWALLTLAALTVLLAASASASAHPGKHVYVLALGDSWTAGTQPTGPQTVPFGSPDQEINRSGEGYADQLVASLRRQGMKVDLVNLACNRETTQTMIDGVGSLCTYPHGSQLEEARQFLHAHGKRTLAVVMSVGAADAMFSCAPFDHACWVGRAADAGTNLATILGSLRAEAGDVPILTSNYWDPFLAAWVFPPLGGPPAAYYSVQFLAEPIDLIEAAYAPFDATIVDTWALFETENFVDTTTLPVFGTVPVNVANICTYTWMCTWGDAHPNSAGYGLIADAFEQALAP